MGVKHFASLNLLITQRPEGSAAPDWRSPAVPRRRSGRPYQPPYQWMRLPKARPPKRYSRSVETTTRLLHVTAPLSCWHVLAVRLQIQNLVGGPDLNPGPHGPEPAVSRIPCCPGVSLRVLLYPIW